MTDPRAEIISAYAATAAMPDDTGHFPTDDALFGGRFMPEALMAVLKEVTEAYETSKTDPAFHREFADLLLDYANRPSLLTEARNLSRARRRRAILLKREDLNHTGSHKINNVLGQALLAKRMGKTRVIAETGAGQHGVATATAAALLGLDCVVYMGAEDTRRQALNVARMRMLGAEVVPVADRVADAEGRDQRGAAGLGRQRRQHATTCWAPPLDRIRSRRWSGTSPGSSVWRLGARRWS